MQAPESTDKSGTENYSASVKRFFEWNLQYHQLMEESAGHLIVHGEEMALYWLLMEDKPLLSGELAKKMRLSSGRIANILHRLEEKGQISRSRTSDDRRQVLVSLTECGRDRIVWRYQDCLNWHRKILEQLSGEEAETFLSLSERLTVSGLLRRQ